jgi:hypothetical protein
MIKHFFVLLFFIFFFFPFLKAQVVINEYLSSNVSGITDEDSDYSDWIELYNNSGQYVNLKGFKISDSEKDTIGWVFPDVSVPAHSFLIVFASGKDKDGKAPKYNTIINQGDTWKYLAPTGTMPANWRDLNFNDTTWPSGKSGFGYGDNDDATVLNNVNLVLIRKEFEITDVRSITSMLLHVDYDDGFIAFINGTAVALGGIAEHSEDYSTVQATGHEALMYNGGNPEEFDISFSISLLKEGKNVIAIQGHNTGTGSSDFTLIPFLTVASPNFTIYNAASFISVEDANLHTNFKIDKSGETLYLYNAEAVLIDSSKAVALENDISYGRYENGSDHWYFFKQPTPGSSNINPLDSIISDSVFFSHQAGFYTLPFELAMAPSSVDAGPIRYTTDGSLPTVNSSIYFAPITVSTTTVVRAAIVLDSSGYNPVLTRTFIFDDPNGLPVISISTDPENFFDWEEGIYVLGPNAQSDGPNFGANFWEDWEKPINFEFFDQQKVQRLNQGAGIKIAGNWSRANAQKSMALYARKSYGKGSFNYKFFHDRENSSFESILIRNSGNDWGYTMFRDGLVSEIARDMDMERLAYQPAKIFLNGEYWGILNIREKPSEHYFEENFGVDEDNVNILEGGEQLFKGKIPIIPLFGISLTQNRSLQTKITGRYAKRWTYRALSTIRFCKYISITVTGQATT